MTPRAPAVPLVDVRLATGAGRRDILGRGWCEAESSGTWTGETEVGLHLPLAPGTRGCVLRITAAPYRVAHKLGMQRVLVLADGRLVGRMRLDEPGVAALAIPAAATQGRRMLTLTLVLPDARRPFELDDSEDRRLLALSVNRVELLSVDPDGDVAGGDVAGEDLPGEDLAAGDLPGRSDAAACGRAGAADADGAAGRDIAGGQDGAGVRSGAAAGGREPADREMLEAFESLGWDAEFGFVQRRVLAEPAGLLRWASGPLGAGVLAEALDAALYGVGDPEQIEVTAHDDAWVATDWRWGFRTRTQVPLHGLGADELHLREAASRAMLRERLLGTLREGRHIVVYKERDPGERGAAGALAEAVAAHGDCPLLWVSQGPQVAVRRRGRWLEATLPVLASPDTLSRVAEEDWLAVCRGAWRLAGRQG